MKGKILTQFIMWLHYNRIKLKIDSNIYGISDKFIKATSKKGKYCTCRNKGRAVNIIWDNWHCTYCLKPKKD